MCFTQQSESEQDLNVLLTGGPSNPLANLLYLPSPPGYMSSAQRGSSALGNQNGGEMWTSSKYLRRSQTTPEKNVCCSCKRVRNSQSTDTGNSVSCNPDWGFLIHTLVSSRLVSSQLSGSFICWALFRWSGSLEGSSHLLVASMYASICRSNEQKPDVKNVIFYVEYKCLCQCATISDDLPRSQEGLQQHAKHPGTWETAKESRRAPSESTKEGGIEGRSLSLSEESQAFEQRSDVTGLQKEDSKGADVELRYSSDLFTPQSLIPQVLPVESGCGSVSLAAPHIGPCAAFTAAAGSGAENDLFVFIAAHSGLHK